MGTGYKMAEKGKHFVLTQKGYEVTPDHVKPERAVGKPVMSLYDDRVPVSWVEKGYVEEVEYE